MGKTAPMHVDYVVFHIRHTFGYNWATKMISAIWILNLGRSAKPEVVNKGILEEERFKSGLEGWIELRGVGRTFQRRECTSCAEVYSVVSETVQHLA